MGGERLKKASFGQALNYMIKSYIGPGCLSLPLAFQHSGALLGMFILTFLFAAIVYNLRGLLLAKRHFEKDGARSYADITLITLGPKWRNVVDGLINVTQLGICSVYFDFVAENLNALLPDSWGDAKSSRPCMAYSYPIFVMLSQLPSVESIAPYTGLANFLILTTIGVVFFLSVWQLGAHGVGDGVTLGRPLQAPLFFATAVYSFEGIANLLPVENALENKDHMFPLLYLSMGIVGLLYVSCGLVSYLAWPHVTAGSITAELEAKRSNALLSLCSWMVIFAVILTFPVQLFPSLELIEERLGLIEKAPVVAASKKKTGLEKMEEESQKGSLLNEERGDDSSVTSSSLSAASSKSSDFSKKSKKQESDKKGLLRAAEEDVENPLSVKDPSLSAVNVTMQQSECDAAVESMSDASSHSPAAMVEGSTDITSSKPKSVTFDQKICRICVVTATGLVAAVVPSLGDLIALIGAVSGSMLAIIIPAMIDLNCPRDYPGEFGKQMRQYERTLNYGLIVIGVVAGLWGTVLAVQATIESLSSGSDE